MTSGGWVRSPVRTRPRKRHRNRPTTTLTVRVTTPAMETSDTNTRLDESGGRPSPPAQKKDLRRSSALEVRHEDEPSWVDGDELFRVWRETPSSVDPSREPDTGALPTHPPVYRTGPRPTPTTVSQILPSRPVSVGDSD